MDDYSELEGNLQVSGAAKYGRRRRRGGDAAASILPLAMQSFPPDVYLNLKSNQAMKGQQIVLASSLTSVSRGSAATQADSSGNWSVAPANTLAQSNLGAAIWESRVNSIRNNTMLGVQLPADNLELLANGNFASQGAGWTSGTSGGGSVVFATGSVTITGNGTDTNNYISQQITGLTVGRNYVVTSLAAAGNFVSAKVGIAPNDLSLAGATLAPNGSTSSNSDRLAFTATATSHWVSFANFNASPVVYTGFSVQDGERAENGTFTSNPKNAAQATVQNGWQWSLNTGTGTVVYNSGPKTVTLTGDGTHYAGINQAISTVAGFTYTITVDATSNPVSVNAGTAAFGTTLLNATSAVGAAQKFQFTATGATTHVSFTRTPTGGAAVGNVSVKSAGALPTNWQLRSEGPTGVIFTPGVLQNINGVNTLAIGVNGTASATGWMQVVFDGIAASAAQVYTGSAFVSAAGALPGTIALMQMPLTSGFVELAVQRTNITPTSSLARYADGSYTLPATTASVLPGLALFVTGGQTYSGVVVVGWPQLELGASASNPILTSGSAATRNAEVDNLILTGLPAFGSSYTLWARGTPQTPSVGTTPQALAEIDDGTFNNRIGLFRTSGALQAYSISGGSSSYNQSSGAWNVSTSGKAALAMTAGAQSAAFNGAALTAGSAALPVGVNNVSLGNVVNANQFDGNLEEVAIWFTKALTPAQLQAITQ